MSRTWMSFSEAAGLLGANFDGCVNEAVKAQRLSNAMCRSRDDGIWGLVDAKGDKWQIDANEVVNIDATRRQTPSYRSILEE